jgi:hypothetical protein
VTSAGRPRRDGDDNSEEDVKPWEAFGVSTEDGPLVRVCLNIPRDWEPPPQAEVHQGVSLITIHIHGDDPSLAFIHVRGLKGEAVRAKWLNAQKVWSDPVIRDQMWQPRPR